MRFFKIITASAIAILAVIYFWPPKFSSGQESAPAIVFGCKNDQNSKCLDIGSANETSSGVKIFKRAKNISTGKYENLEQSLDSIFANEKLTEQYWNYRNFQLDPVPEGYQSAYSTDYLSFDSMGSIDENGFPQDEYMLEIHYKDIYKNDGTAWQYDKRFFIESMLAYGSPQIGSLEVGKLLGAGSNDWKYEQIYFPKTHWQRIRATGGKFNFALRDRREIRNPLPIDYIVLKKLTSAESKQFTDGQKNRYQISDYVETNPAPNITGYKWFSAPSMKPIYPNQYPLANEIQKPIQISSAYGQIEPFNFGIYTKQQLNGVSFVKNNLALKGNPNVQLSAEKISIKKVVYADKFWAFQGGHIGLQPDFPDDFSSINIPANASQQFWGEVTVDDGITPGEYEGKINIKINGVVDSSQSIPIKVKVIPITLTEPNYIRALYHDPSIGTFQGLPHYQLYGNVSKVKKDMKAHGIDNVIGALDISVPANCGQITENDYKKFKDNFLKLKSEGLIGKTAVFKMSPFWGNVYSSCTSGEKWWTRYQDDRFKTKLSEGFTEVKRFVEENGNQIVLIGEDEPQKDAAKNFQVAVTAKVAHEVGLKVWSTYSSTAAKEKICGIDRDPTEARDWEYCEPCNSLEEDFCYKKSGSNASYLPGLNSYVDYKAWSMGSIDAEQNDRQAPGFNDSFGYYTTGSTQIRNPIINRFLNGYYPENAEGTGAKIIANWTYIGEAGSDPFNEFDQNPRYGSERYRADYLLSYPNWDGDPLATFSMKGMREGIKDAKYIATLRKFISANPNDKVAQEAKNFLDTMLDDNHVKPRYKDDYATNVPTGFYKTIVKYLSGGANATEANLDDYEIFDNNRKKMIDLIEAFKKPSISVSANKTETWRGDEIIYSVEMNNPTATQIQNANIKVPIPQGTQYQNASATEGAVLEGNNLKWVKNIQAGQKFRATFKVRVN